MGEGLEGGGSCQGGTQAAEHAADQAFAEVLSLYASATGILPLHGDAHSPLMQEVTTPRGCLRGTTSETNTDGCAINSIV